MQENFWMLKEALKEKGSRDIVYKQPYPKGNISIYPNKDALDEYVSNSRKKKWWMLKTPKF